ncbi:MAG: RDD family protein [Candidatus Eisenbacteria bacterium]
MFCGRCGRGVPDGARFCPNCGAAVTVVTVPDTDPVATAPPVVMPATPPAYTATGMGSSTATMPWPGEATTTAPFGAPAAAARAYGGFWRRTVAAILDGVLLSILMSPIYLAWVWPTLLSAERGRPEDMDPTQAFSILGTLLMYLVVTGLIETAYFAFLESSSQQASLGKLAMGLQVTDLEGRRITFGKAVMRRVARTLTGFTFTIGFLMVLWTRRHQTLHDLLVGTLVTRR